jgi:hypothetical protein
MNEKTQHVANLNGYDVYYLNGCFTVNPIADLNTLQRIVSYLIAEGFINDDCF